MKIKILLHLFVVAGLAIFASGCCTQSLLDYSNNKTHDIFFPAAIYQSTNGNNFALEGDILKKQVPRPGSYYVDEGPSIHSYLIIKQQHWPPQNFQTNGNLWIDEIEKSSPRLATNSIAIEMLPPDYKKIIDLPKNHVGLEIKEYRPNKAARILLPIAVTGDIALSPVYLILFLAYLPFMHGE